MPRVYGEIRGAFTYNVTGTGNETHYDETVFLDSNSRFTDSLVPELTWSGPRFSVTATGHRMEDACTVTISGEIGDKVLKTVTFSDNCDGQQTIDKRQFTLTNIPLERVDADGTGTRYRASVPAATACSASFISSHVTGITLYHKAKSSGKETKFVSLACNNGMSPTSFYVYFFNVFNP
jgi:hypothetical protein